MGKRKLWEELEKEYKIYNESINVYFCIILEMLPIIKKNDFKFRGIETNIYQFMNDKKTVGIRTPDLLYISKDTRTAVIIEIVASFSENYGMKQIKDLLLYNDLYGIVLPFLEQNVVFVLPKKDYGAFQDFKEEYVSKHTECNSFFSRNFGILLWEFNPNSDCYHFFLKEKTLKKNISNMFMQIKVIGPEIILSYYHWPLFLRNANIPYTCERIQQLLLTPKIFRKGAWDLEPFEFTLRTLYEKFKNMVEEGATGITSPPFPKPNHLKQCLEVFLKSKQIIIRDPTENQVYNDTILISSYSMLIAPFKTHRHRSSMAQIYCKLTARWKQERRKKKKKEETKKGDSTLDEYF
ncbi:hypothetical protein CEE45_04830 [Candidatus Heimdallarchaeota archaeon B3_Heim]|nr:MAG: hypothetical protein CEE45_04830 [Candidatus Heimdallarchaeota archaeon B3_Heim]